MVMQIDFAAEIQACIAADHKGDEGSEAIIGLFRDIVDSYFDINRTSRCPEESCGSDGSSLSSMNSASSTASWISLDHFASSVWTAIARSAVSCLAGKDLFLSSNINPLILACLDMKFNRRSLLSF